MLEIPLRRDFLFQGRKFILTSAFWSERPFSPYLFLAQRILEKNNSLFLDGHIYSFNADGLLMWRIDEPWGHREAQVIATQKAASVLSESFEYGPDYFWSLPTHSVEWHRLRSSLSVTSHTLFMGREYALEIIEDARTLDAEIRRELEAR